MPGCVLLTWTAHAPPVCVHVFGRKSELPNSLSAYSAPCRRRLPSLQARVGLVGSSRPARQGARKAGSPGPRGAVVPTPASPSLRDSPPATYAETLMCSFLGGNTKGVTHFGSLGWNFSSHSETGRQISCLLQKRALFSSSYTEELCGLDSHTGNRLEGSHRCGLFLLKSTSNFLRRLVRFFLAKNQPGLFFYLHCIFLATCSILWSSSTLEGSFPFSSL